MLKTSKIKSFTLSEMIVVIVITSIVAGLAFSVLNLVQKQMKGMAHHYAETTQWHLLEQSLWVSFHRYQHISYDPEKQQLRLKHELDSVSYIFYEDKVIKEKDTFLVAVKNKVCYYKGKTISKGLVDAIELQPEKEKEQQHKKLFVFKKNDAANTINSWHFN